MSGVKNRSRNPQNDNAPQAGTTEIGVDPQLEEQMESSRVPLKEEDQLDSNQKPANHDDQVIAEKGLDFSDPASRSEDMLVVKKIQLWKYVLSMGAGTMHVGWAILGNAQTALILVAKFGWDETETPLYNGILSVIGLFGIMMGSIFGGPLITYGRRVCIFGLAAVMVLGVTLTLIESFPTLVIGRFITGFCGGVYQLCNIKAVQETVPSKLIGIYGTSAGAILAAGCFTVTIIGGITLPTSEDDYKDDQMWRISYGAPLLIVLFQLMLVIFVWRYEPIDFLIRKERDSEAIKFLPKIYSIPESAKVKTNQQDCDSYYQAWIKKRREELISDGASQAKISFKDALFGAQYWRATWISFGLMVCNQFSAIGPVCIFASTLIKEVQEITNGEFPITIRDSVTIIGAVALVSAWSGALPARYFGRIPILAVSHFALAITHATIGILYHFKQFLAMYVFIQFFVFWYYIGTGNVGYIYVGEVCVDQASGFALSALWGTEIILSFLISYMINSPLGVVHTFTCYAVLNAIAFVYVLLMKETRGKTAIELQDLYTPKQKTSQISSLELGKVKPSDK